MTTRRRGSGVRRKAQPVGDHDEFVEASEEYARSLPAKVRALAAAVERAKTGDESAFVVARSLAHRLSGTAGCYGFADLGVVAAAIDEMLPFVEAEPAKWSAIDRALDDLQGMLARRVG